MATTPDFLGSLSSRDKKMDAYYGRIPEGMRMEK